MACYRPVQAWRSASGAIEFRAEREGDRPLSLPCGHCIGCRLARSRAWALRCLHESQLHADSCFVTLTYDDAHYTPSLNYSDFQRFMKRLRRAHYRVLSDGEVEYLPVRFFMCGEYGDLNGRPHYHALLFGVSFSDLSPVSSTLFRSPTLEKLWPFGFSSIGSVSYESAGYVARYSLKKEYGARAGSHYRRVDLRTGEFVQVVPEFAHMSLKPGIGYNWFKKYWKEVHLARDGVVVKGGFTFPVPRYYDKLLLDMDSDLKEFRDFTRYNNGLRFRGDSTPERLAVREIVAKARIDQYKRHI